MSDDIDISLVYFAPTDFANIAFVYNGLPLKEVYPDGFTAFIIDKTSAVMEVRPGDCIAEWSKEIDANDGTGDAK